jgi:c-di-GMP-binding flagellar brake protein YcgR
MRLYSRYFKPGQKIFLRSLAPATAGRLEALTVYFQEFGPDRFILALPYGARGGEQYPFSSEMSFQILSQTLGLGIRLTGTFLNQPEEDLISIKVHDDLQIYQHRVNRRMETTVGLRYTKGQGTLRSFREQWEKNIRILQGGQSRIPEFPPCQVNLSAGGIRFRIKAPVEIADLCLLLIDLGDSRVPLCILAEVVWIEEQISDGRRLAGLQFLNILEADQQRIAQFISRKNLENGEKKNN